MADLDELFGSDSDDDDFQPTPVWGPWANSSSFSTILHHLPCSNAPDGGKYIDEHFIMQNCVLQAATAAASEDAAEEDLPEEPAEEKADEPEEAVEEDEESGPAPSEDDVVYREPPPERPSGPPLALDAPPIARLGELLSTSLPHTSMALCQ